MRDQDQKGAGLWRKKPVVIEAFRLGEAWPDWWAEAHIANRAVTFNKDGRWRGGPDYAEIQTLEGVMRANNGDWIIKGVKGELYPCKPDVFEATYEPAEAPTNTGLGDLDLDGLEKVARAANVPRVRWAHDPAPTDEVLAIDEVSAGVAVVAKVNPMAEWTDDTAEAWCAHIATFDPPTCLALLQELRRLRSAK